MVSSPPPPSLYSHIFQPPQSPSSASFSMHHTATGVDDYFSPRSRKRSRRDTSSIVHNAPQTPGSATPGWLQCPTPSDGMYGSACARGSAVVNERYMLDGGFDTPGLMAADERHGANGSSAARELDQGARRRVRDVDEGDEYGSGEGAGAGGVALPISGPLARERNGAARVMPSSPNGSSQAGGGWTSFAIQLVGQVFHFGSTVIKGFYAGGGRGYELGRSSHSDGWTTPRPTGTSTPVPGSWWDDGEATRDFGPDDGTPSSGPQPWGKPPNKRRQTDRDAWVLVGTPDPTDTSPRRKASSSAAVLRRSSLAGPRPAASRPNSRRRPAPMAHRRQSSYGSSSYAASPPAATYNVPHNQQTYFDQHTSPTSPPQRASFAPTRSASRPSTATGPASSPLRPDTERFVKRQARHDRAADRAMTSMSRRLEALIRQGQEALGTQFSVEGGSCGGGMEDDEGFVDEDEELEDEAEGQRWW